MCNVRKVDLTISSYQKIYKSYDLNIIAWLCHNMYDYMLIRCSQRTSYDLNIIAWLCHNMYDYMLIKCSQRTI